MNVIEFKVGEHDALWSEFVSGHSDACVYHTRQWAEVVRGTFPFKEISLMCVSDGGEVHAILPLWQINRDTVVNSPWRDRADLLVRNQESKRLILERLCAIRGDLLLRGWTHEAPSRDFLIKNYWVTSRLDLKPGKEAVWRNLDKSVPRNVKRADNHGIEIRQANSLEHMTDFYRLFKKTRKRLGVPIFPWVFFKNMFDHLKDSMRIYSGYFKGKPIGSIIILNSPHLAIYAYGAYDYAYRYTRVNDKLFWRAIRDSIDAGRSVFDFGADSPSQTGLLRFKEKWGGAQKVLPVLCRNNRDMDFAREDFSSPNYSFHRRILSHMPAWVLTLLGAIYMKKRG